MAGRRPTAIYGIVVLGILCVVVFGVLAIYLEDTAGRRMRHRLAEVLPVEVDHLEDDRDEDGRPRLTVVVRPGEEGEVTPQLAWSAADVVFGEWREVAGGILPYDVVRVRAGEAKGEEAGESVLRRIRDRRNEVRDLLPVLRRAVEEAVATRPEISLRLLPGGLFGVDIRIDDDLDEDGTRRVRRAFRETAPALPGPLRINPGEDGPSPEPEEETS